jgi:hypothetical protein
MKVFNHTPIMIKETVVDLDQHEIGVLLYALESLTENDEYYLAEKYTSPNWVKEKLETILKNMV